MSAHCTISPSGPPFRTLGLKTSPDSSVRKPTWTRIYTEEEEHRQHLTDIQYWKGFLGFARTVL